MLTRIQILMGLVLGGLVIVVMLANGNAQAAPRSGVREGLRPSPAQTEFAPAPPTTVDASAALGGVITYLISLNNLGQPATTVRLYEAWPPSSAAAAVPAAPMRVPLPQRPGPITEALLAELRAAPDGRAEMLIYLRDQADLSAAAIVSDWDARGRAVVEVLRGQAAATQPPLLAEMRARVFEPRSYWIVNLIAVRGDLALAQWAATQADVALITENAIHTLDEQSPAPAIATDTAWGLERVRAPQAWETWGVRGEGIVVANIDSGAVYTHPALLQSYRGSVGQSIAHDYNWYDPAPKNPFPAPDDLVGHGTHTMGTLAGGRAASGLQIGMAPGARWIAARGCAGNFCADEALIASAQWMLAPTDRNLENPRPDLRPHIISNSWGASGESNWYTGFVEAWNAAGIFSTFAIGNSGGLFGCGSNSSPGNYSASLAVGATDAEDYIAPFSSRGPTSDGRIKPDLSAPGVNVPSAWLDGSEASLSGTSMATPHVAGAAALLWSANPALIGDLAATRALLTGTALPRTGSECDSDFNAVPNNVYGWGRLDAYAAVQAARVNVPWLSVPASAILPANGTYTLEVTLDARQLVQPARYEARILQVRGNTVIPIPASLTVTPVTGTARLTGQLRDRWTGAGVYGRVTAGAGPPIETDAGGAFTATLPVGSYPLAASAYAYVPATVTTNLLTDTQQLITLTADAPHIQVLAPVLSATLPFGARSDAPVQVRNLGPQPLNVSVSVPPLEWSVAAAPSAALYDLSGFPALPLADDMIYTDALSLPFALPVYGALYDHVYLSSNGWVSVQPASNALPQAVCFASTLLPPGTLAGLWTDLDPAQGGSVRAGALDADTFVIGWEAVPPWRATPDPAGPAFTFQIILRSNGAVEYRYGPIGTLQWPWSVGVFGDEGRAQILACMRGSAVTALADNGWLLQNQPRPDVWLSGSPQTLTVAPNGVATVMATLRGLGYVPWRTEPFAAALRLSSNDPLQPITDLAAQVSAGPPAAQLWLPLIGR